MTPIRFRVEVEEIVADLNAVTGKNFKPTSVLNRKWISARLSEGFTVDDFKRVHRIKAAEWLGTDRDRWLCPETLYRPSHFESYLNQRLAPHGPARLSGNIKEAMEFVDGTERPKEIRAGDSQAELDIPGETK